MVVKREKRGWTYTAVVELAQQPVRWADDRDACEKGESKQKRIKMWHKAHLLALSSIWRVKREISTLWYAAIINNSIVGPRKLQQTKHRRHMERPICLSSRLISIYRQDQHYSSSSMQEAHAALDLEHLFCNMAVHHLRNSGPVSGPAVSCSAECRLPGRDADFSTRKRVLKVMGCTHKVISVVV